ncbi:hypothetical protein J7L13_02810 [bacterium]|nr:hypothetical protein [bacterium]
MPYVMTQNPRPEDEIVPEAQFEAEAINPEDLPPHFSKREAEILLSAGADLILHPWIVSAIIAHFYPGWKMVWRPSSNSLSSSINFSFLADNPKIPKIRCPHLQTEVKEIPAGWGQKVKIRRCLICGEVLRPPAGGPG